MRAATGQLYAVGYTSGVTDTGRLYRIDPGTGTATVVGAPFSAQPTASAVLRQALRRRRSVPLTLVATCADAAGDQGTASARVTARR